MCVVCVVVFLLVFNHKRKPAQPRPALLHYFVRMRSCVERGVIFTRQCESPEPYRKRICCMVQKMKREHFVICLVAIVFAATNGVTGYRQIKSANAIGARIKSVLRQSEECSEQTFRDELGEECYNALQELEAFDQEAFDSVCTENCIGKFIYVLVEKCDLGDQESTEIDYLELICAKNSENKYCFPLLGEELGSEVGNVETVCPLFNESVPCASNCSGLLQSIVDQFGCCFNLFISLIEEFAGSDIYIPYETCSVDDPGECDTVEPESHSGSVRSVALLLFVMVSMTALV